MTHRSVDIFQNLGKQYFLFSRTPTPDAVVPENQKKTAKIKNYNAILHKYQTGKPDFPNKNHNF